MRRIDATLANAGSEARLHRTTTRTRPEEAEVLALLAAARGASDGQDAWEPVHALIWCHDGLFGGCASRTGFHLATLRQVPFSFRDALEIRLFAPGFELYGVPCGDDSLQPGSDPWIHWTLHREADDAGWVPAPPALFPAEDGTMRMPPDAASVLLPVAFRTEEMAGVPAAMPDGHDAEVETVRFRCLTEFHHVFGTTCTRVAPIANLAENAAPAFREMSPSVPPTTDGMDCKEPVSPRIWRLSEPNRGIHWHLAAAGVAMKTFETRRVRHAWGNGANLFLAVRHYLQTDPADGSLSTLSVCLGGFWRLSPDERHLEEVRPA